MQKNVKTIGAYREGTDLIFKDFKKIIHLVTLSLFCPAVADIHAVALFLLLLASLLSMASLL
jgi:hypothetical protein